MKPIVNTIFNIEILSISNHKQRMMQGCLLSSHLFNIVLDILTIAIRQEKEIKGKIGKEKVKLYLLVNNMIVYIGNYKESTNKIL